MSTRVFLIRHGATPLVAEDRFAGETNVALSDLGREQARRVGRRLAGVPLGAVYASPMDRTVATAKAIADPHGLTVHTRDGLREISHGRWEQLTRKEVEAKFGDEYACWEEDPFTFAPVGGETGLTVVARALPVLREIVTAHPEEQVAIISHKATIRLLLCVLLGFDPRTYRDRLDQSPACLNILDFKDPAHARLTLFNDVAHYADAGLELPAAPKGRLSKWWDGAGKQ
ncbi:MAG TPA: histidine phosphatase family protein [Candidatus Limnocylindria bacterium]|jgi:probable phosphoglycerate mutase|nr:histidine phosphatase family protein [Candidatus Limnocylindria bacterium]